MVKILAILTYGENMRRTNYAEKPHVTKL